MADKRGILSLVLNRREVKVPSEADDYRYLRYHWGTAYAVIRPSRGDDTWKAIARFGNHDQLVTDTANELLELIRRHYSPDTEGYAEMLMARLGWKYT